MYISMLVAHSANLGMLTGYYWNNVIDDIMWKVVNVFQSNQFREIVKITEEKENNTKQKHTHTCSVV